MGLYINETHVNEDEGYRYGDEDWFEAFTDNIGELYRFLKAEYGNGSNMYIGEGVKVGWVFSGRAKYTDCEDTFKRSVWVSVSTTKPEKVTELTNVTSPWEAS